MQRGFSLIEVIVATALLATAVAGFAQLLTAAAAASLAARTGTTATILAEQKMEQLRSVPFALLNGGVEYLTPSGTIVCSSAIVPCAAASYERRWSVEPAAHSPAVSIVVVAVTPVGAANGSAFLTGARARRSP